MGAYAPPTIGPSGLVLPSYNSILNYLTSTFLSIYGQNYYLGNDSAAYQLLSLIALVCYDSALAIQQAYNNMSPATATGAGLSLLVALNGLQRLAASYSTCLVTVSGVAGTVVTGGVIQNSVTGDLWNLPNLTIPSGGSITVTATAQQSGPINAAASQLTVITTPVGGWNSVTNGSNTPSLGQPVETDSALRQRQALSVALPSRTILAGTIAAIAATPGVTRYQFDENVTNTTNGNGTPGHSIQAIIEGGAQADIASAIYYNKGIGCGTYGTVIFPFTDPATGLTQNIQFTQPPNYVLIYVVVNAHNNAGGSLTSAQIQTIQNGIAAYLNGLQIGASVSFGEMVQAAAAAVNSNPEMPAVSIRSPFYFGTTAAPTTSTDIAIAFGSVAQGNATNVTVNSV